MQRCHTYKIAVSKYSKNTVGILQLKKKNNKNKIKIKIKKYLNPKDSQVIIKNKINEINLLLRRDLSPRPSG